MLDGWGFPAEEIDGTADISARDTELTLGWGDTYAPYAGSGTDADGDDDRICADTDGASGLDDSCRGFAGSGDGGEI